MKLTLINSKQKYYKITTLHLKLVCKCTMHILDILLASWFFI